MGKEQRAVCSGGVVERGANMFGASSGCKSHRGENVSMSEGRKKENVSMSEGRKKENVSMSEGRKKENVSMSEGRKTENVSMSEGSRQQRLMGNNRSPTETRELEP